MAGSFLILRPLIKPIYVVPRKGDAANTKALKRQELRNSLAIPFLAYLSVRVAAGLASPPSIWGFLNGLKIRFFNKLIS